MKNATLVLASVGSFVLTLVVFVAEVSATNCTTKCSPSNQCIGTNQACAACNTSGGFGSCGVQYNYWNAPVPVVAAGASTTTTAAAGCYSFGNCTVGAPVAFTGCGAAGCAGWWFSSCYPCTPGPLTVSWVNVCTDNGCNEG